MPRGTKRKAFNDARIVNQYTRGSFEDFCAAQRRRIALTYRGSSHPLIARRASAARASDGDWILTWRGRPHPPAPVTTYRSREPRVRDD